MPSAKSEIMAIIEQMPEGYTRDEVLRELNFKTRVDKGLQQLADGEGIPFEEAKGRLKWLN